MPCPMRGSVGGAWRRNSCRMKRVILHKTGGLKTNEREPAPCPERVGVIRESVRVYRGFGIRFADIFGWPLLCSGTDGPFPAMGRAAGVSGAGLTSRHPGDGR